MRQHEHSDHAASSARQKRNDFIDCQLDSALKRLDDYLSPNGRHVHGSPTRARLQPGPAELRYIHFSLMVMKRCWRVDGLYHRKCTVVGPGSKVPFLATLVGKWVEIPRRCKGNEVAIMIQLGSPGAGGKGTRLRSGVGVHDRHHHSIDSDGDQRLSTLLNRRRHTLILDLSTTTHQNFFTVVMMT